MDLPLIPVANGMFPRPDGGTMKGAFLNRAMSDFLRGLTRGAPLFLCPYSSDRGGFYSVGVVVEIRKVWAEEISFWAWGGTRKITMCEVVGKTRAKASSLVVRDGKIIALNLKRLDLKRLRSQGYPVIEGAGWQALGGYTETRDTDDIRVTVYGYSLESGDRLGIQGNLKGLVEPELAHSIEHAVIRSLGQYGMCTPKTLVESLGMETGELKESVEAGFRWGMPEVFGQTSSGACGNPLTNLAHFYLEREVLKGLSEGEGLFRSLDEARKKTLSQLTEALDISALRGVRTLQGLKRGMLHDDSSQLPGKMSRVLSRFPASPWE